MSDRILIGVDIGGTFTDVVLQGPDGSHSCKVLTTHQAPELAVLEGIQTVCQLAQTPPAEIGQIIHGTTLATNALIERHGAKTALITTEGFRDVIEMRTESRFEQYDLNLELPEPLLARQHRYTLSERIGAAGQVLRPLARAQVEQLVLQLKAEGYQSIAVAFLHSYVNAQHEELVRDVLADLFPQAMVSLSGEVSPQMREYERFNTVVANAYIKPLMKSYLERLEDALSGIDVACDVFLMHSGGGIIDLHSAAEFPVRLVESGPAGGAVFAASVAARFGLDKVLSFDMGGTTAKICLIDQQSPKTNRVFEVARSYRFKKGSGMPITIPVIEMVEIGAGGGSLTTVDRMQQIRIGPESAGSEPGPACYQRGGDKPAVTDADLLLGRLSADEFAGGKMPLSETAAERALDHHIGSQLGLNTLQAAWGVSEVVDENMANAARVHAVENGEDLADYTMIAFGGAAALHAGRIASKLGISRWLVPRGAGVGSAMGFLQAPFSFTANRSVVMNVAELDAERVSQLLAELRFEAEQFVQRCEPNAELVAECKAYMRYRGQGWEIPVVLEEHLLANPSATNFCQAFEAAYQKLFHRLVAGMQIEVTAWSVNVSTLVPPQPSCKPPAHQQAALVSAQRNLFSEAAQQQVSAAVMQRTELNIGDQIVGPAVVVEDETTIVIPEQWQAMVCSDGTLEIHSVQVDSGDSTASVSATTDKA